MRNRLIAAILGLFGTLTGVQAAPDVTSEITYDLASGRADYYFWKDGFAPIFPDTCYHLTHYWPAAADIPV
ncbi:hypothetical protein ACXYVN_21800, partial [Escherichia coli]